MIDHNITVVGTGLMGGSLALALRPHLHHLAVVDTDPETLAATANVADVATADFASGVQGADLVILATPGRTILHLLAELSEARPEGCMVLDLGSTKRDICKAMENLPATFQAIGGHPMCGKETSGFASASTNLFRDQTFVLCRNGRTHSEIEELAVEIVSRIGARSLFLPADLHDDLVAATSHLPYVAAAALMRTVFTLEDHQPVWQVSASGLRDTVRLAGSNPKMMLDILLSNRSKVLAQLEKYQNELADIAELLRVGDEKELANWLVTTQLQHATYRNRKHGSKSS